jgi:hypothetical protein
MRSGNEIFTPREAAFLSASARANSGKCCSFLQRIDVVDK